MNREERNNAAEVLGNMLSDIADNKLYGIKRDEINAILRSIVVLRDYKLKPAQTEQVNPTTQPDPETGLVPCGCGGKARIKHDGSHSSKCVVENVDGSVRYETATVVYPGNTHAWVDCDNEKCRCSVGYCGGLIFRTDEEARDAWNVAMGWR